MTDFYPASNPRVTTKITTELKHNFCLVLRNESDDPIWYLDFKDYDHSLCAVGMFWSRAEAEANTTGFLGQAATTYTAKWGKHDEDVPVIRLEKGELVTRRAHELQERRRDTTPVPDLWKNYLERHAARRALEASADYVALRSLLAASYPHLFADDASMPMAKGTFDLLLDVVTPRYDRDLLKAVIRAHCKRDDYLRAVAAGVLRMNLDGTVAGTPTEHERSHALARLERRDTKRTWRLDHHDNIMATYYRRAETRREKALQALAQQLRAETEASSSPRP